MEQLTPESSPKELDKNIIDKIYEREKNRTTENDKKPELITFKELIEAVNLLKDCEPMVQKMLHNVDAGKLGTIASMSEDCILRMTIYGVGVYKRTYVPENEIWMVDAKGDVLRRFYIN